MFLSELIKYILMFIVFSIPYYFMYRTLGLSGYLAFIPIYSQYRLLSEYKGRTLLKNWGVIYFITIVLYIIFLGFTGFLILLLLGEGSKYNEQVITIAVPLISLTTSLLVMILYFVNLILPFCAVMKEKMWRIIFVVSLVMFYAASSVVNYVLISFHFIIDVQYIAIFSAVLYSLMYLMLTFMAYSSYKKVKRGTMKVVDRLDLKTLSKQEAKRILKERKLYLLTTIE